MLYEPVQLGVFHLWVSMLLVHSYNLLFYKQAVIFVCHMKNSLDIRLFY